jgi:hypothetical protein
MHDGCPTWGGPPLANTGATLIASITIIRAIIVNNTMMRFMSLVPFL